jgi:hypothetical protein
MDKTEHFKQYLSGFFDGDGSIGLEKQGTSGYTLRIKFSQSNEDFINTIQRIYPYLKKYGDVRDSNSRTEYQLRAAGSQIEPLIDDLLPYSILKYEQLLEAKKYFQLIKVQNKKTEKEEIYNKLKSLKKHSTLKPYERLTIPYIAGLFDAEGCVKLYENDLTIGISQKSDTIILQKIAEMYNNTNAISNYSVRFYSSNCKQLLEDILPYTIYKTSQIKPALEFIKTLNTYINQEVVDKRTEFEKIIKNEKHVDINKNNILFKNQDAHKNYLIKIQYYIVNMNKLK